MSWHNVVLTYRSPLGRSWLRSPAAPCRPSPETALSVGYYLCLGDLVQKQHKHTVRHESMQIQPSVKLLSGFSFKDSVLTGRKNLKVSFKFRKPASCLRTRTKENDGFEVGIFIRVWGQLQHAVTELLHPPNVLHYQFYSLRRKLLCRRQKTCLEE